MADKNIKAKLKKSYLEKMNVFKIDECETHPTGALLVLREGFSAEADGDRIFIRGLVEIMDDDSDAQKQKLKSMKKDFNDLAEEKGLKGGGYSEGLEF